MKLMVPRNIGLPDSRYDTFEVDGIDLVDEAWEDIKWTLLKRADSDNGRDGILILRDIYLNDSEDNNVTELEYKMLMDPDVVQWIIDFWDWVYREWNGNTPSLSEIGIDGFLYDYILGNLFEEVNGPIYDPKRHTRKDEEHDLQKRLDAIRKKYRCSRKGKGSRRDC